jgi:NAD(P)-dependent dehydrogenase (short-subunit alcohol dehydrogenase family)
VQISGSNAVVTGGGSGLGAATARRLAACGASVAVLDRDGVAAERVAATVPGRMFAVQVDVADESSVAAAFETITSRFGAVGILVSAAGVATAGKVVSGGKALPLETFRSVIDVNLVGLFDVLRRTAELMVAATPAGGGERGVIVNVSSGAAFQGQKGQAAYAASKAAVIGLMLPVARDLARHGVRVVSIAPGLFETGMSAGFTPELVAQLQAQILYPKRLGNSEEFADLVTHVVENRYLNATTLSIDAGVRMT